jgi:hypothetical protein
MYWEVRMAFTCEPIFSPRMTFKCEQREYVLVFLFMISF